MYSYSGYVKSLAIGGLMLMMCAGGQSALAQPSWETAVGGPNQETAHKVVRTNAFGYEDWVLAAGGTDSYATSFSANPPNLYVTHTDGSGAMANGFVFDLQCWDDDYSIVELENLGQFVVTTGVWNEHTGSYDIGVICCDYNGMIVWSRFFGDVGRDGGTSIIRMQNGILAGELVVAGTYENAAGDQDGLVMVLNHLNGSLLRSRRIDCSNSFRSNDRFMSVREDITNVAFDPGHVFLTGTTNAANSTTRDDDVWVMRIDVDDYFMPFSFSNVYDMGGTNQNDRGYNLVQTENASVWSLTVVGETYATNVYGSRNDAFALRLDPSGVYQWAGRYNLEQQLGDNSWDIAYDVQESIQNPGSGYVVLTGQTNSAIDRTGQGFTLEVDNNGTPSQPRIYGRQGYNSFRSIDRVGTTGFCLGGMTNSDGYGGDQWIVYATPALNTGLDVNTMVPCVETAQVTATYGAVSNNINFTVDQFLDVPAAPRFNIELNVYPDQICQGPPTPQVTDVKADNDSDHLLQGRQNVLAVSPNPLQAGSDLIVNISSGLNQDWVLTVRDVTGRSVVDISGVQHSNGKKLHLNTERWAAGSYTLTITDGQTTQTAQVIVLN